METARGFVMVSPALKTKSAPKPQEKKTPPFKYTTVSIQEIFEKELRLEASVFGIEGRQARKDIENCKFPTINLCGRSGLATSYHRPRFKRVYVEKSNYPIYQPSQVNELYPKPSAYISDLTQTDIDALRVKKGQVLLTCSGTIGNCTYVCDTLDNLIFSHDLIRIKPKEYNGYIYAYLKSKIGFSIINTNNYGAVVSHIEPEHLNNISIPNPPPFLKQQIHNLIEYSFRLRDESNDLMNKTQLLLKQAFQLPDIEVLKEKAKQYDKKAGLLNYSVPLGELNNRLDASYHVPIVDAIEKHLQKHAQEVTTIGDSRISKRVFLPSRFKRIYVEEGNGINFFGGKQLLEIAPSTGKYLSFGKHNEIIENELKLKENQLLITRSGTIGKVAMVPEHWGQWVASEDIIRITPSNNYISGYLYAYLTSPYGYILLTRQSFGAVQDHISEKQVAEIKIPLCHDVNIQKQINNTVLNANKKRAKAYALEQEALAMLYDKVIYA